MKYILWIDDESMLKEDILMTLEQLGGTPIVCSNIADALRFLRERRDDPPSLIVLDYLLPIGMGETGCDLVKLRRRVTEIDTRLLPRYAGLLILEAFPHLRDRTVALSLASRDMVARHPLAARIPHFSKLELPFDWEKFEVRISSLYHETTGDSQ